MRASAAGLPSWSPSIARLLATAISSMAAAASSTRPCTLWSARKASAGACKSAENLLPCQAYHSRRPCVWERQVLSTPTQQGVPFTWHGGQCTMRDAPGGAERGLARRARAARSQARHQPAQACSSACALMPLMPKELVPGTGECVAVQRLSRQLPDHGASPGAKTCRA